ncbi:MAG: ATP-dependent Clp protease proteolytic subunit [Ruminococcus sp.]|nr:ATP-dependent Clp protease proteolytic subunit [Ruminococcus sp.]
MYRPDRNSYDTLPRAITSPNCGDSRDTDIFARSFSKGRIFLTGEITMNKAVRFMAVMAVLSDEKRDAEIIINSSGGEVAAGLLIYDIIRSYPCGITMYCAGAAESIAAVIFASGKKGRRFMLPFSTVMIHAPVMSINGIDASAECLCETARSIVETRTLLNGILAKHTGRTAEEIEEAAKKDFRMNARQAEEFGISDGIKSIFSDKKLEWKTS